ncbi:MAG TPA: formate dehydrogenase, partial [Acetobacteraceae bacterium]|nr:formate dehydrogenase [Acetobacteraceae bacterium]
MTRVFVPCDMMAVALGADRVARALAAAPGVEIVRTGSRGLQWLEPLVEVETPAGRIAYGPVSPADVEPLLQAGLLTGAAHSLRIGRPEDLPYLARQQRLTFSRTGLIDPLSFDEYCAHGGLTGLKRALEIGAAATVEDVKKSGLRGRGGA